jgi:hypothetical protein
MEPAMIYKFEVSQSILPTNPVRPRRNTYLFVKHLPLISNEPQYWVEGMRSGLDCIVCKAQIEATDEHQQKLWFAAQGFPETGAQSGHSS